MADNIVIKDANNASATLATKDIGGVHHNKSISVDVTGNAMIGSSTARLLSAAATTNGTSVKASAGSIMAITLQNVSASIRYLKFYNKATAPTVGTDTPVLTFHIPPSGMFTLDRPQGTYFSTGIAYAITGAAADADTTAIVAGDIVCLNLEYA